MAFTTINDPSVYFQTVLYTGDGNSTQAITNDGNSDLQPDWIWTKQRSHAVGHNLTDSSRGASKALFSEVADAEDTGGNISSFNSDGFTTTDANRTNQSGRTFVAWQWKANGGTTTTNDASATSVGTIDSVYQANTTAGFSIVTHTGTGANGTIAHGLGTAPSVVLLKCRSNGGSSWMMFHTGLGNNAKTLALEESDAEVTESSPYYSFNNTAPTSTVFSVGSGNTTNGSSRTFVTYCFAEKQGYSKFGNYVGNGSSEGTYVYTGFRPAWIMIKRTDSSTNGNWFIIDDKRSTGNVRLGHLRANQTNEENTSTNQSIDFLANGFKLRDSNTSLNSGSYVYLAFAKHPFTSSKGVPATAV